MEYILLSLILSFFIMLLYFTQIKRGYFYRILCPKCNNICKVQVYGSADQFEVTNCSCGHHEFEVI